MSEIMAFQAIVIVCGTAAFIASLRFARRFLELKQERALRSPETEVTERLDRIEVAVESTAVEVERIAEANRFVAKLLVDRPGPVPAMSRPERVITPH